MRSRRSGTIAAVIFLFVGLFVLGMGRSAAAAALAPITVQVEGAPLAMDVAPVVVADRTLVPVRFIGEAVAGTVDWDPESQQVTVIAGERTIVITVGQDAVTVNGQPAVMEVPAQIVEGRTMVPLRFIAEALGCTVEWDAETRTANILRRPSVITDMTYEVEGGTGKVRLRLSEPVLSVTPRVEGTSVYLDLYPAQVEVQQAERLVYDGLARAVRLSTDGRTAALQADLWEAAPQRYTVSPDGTEVTLEFAPVVRSVQFHEEGRSPQVVIATTAEVGYTVQEDSAAHRLIIDLDDAVPGADVAAVQQINHAALTSISTSARPGGGTRVVLQMPQEAAYDVVSTPLGLEVRLWPQLLTVQTDQYGDRTRLILNGDLPMDAQVAVQGNQLVIEIPQGRSGTAAGVQTVNDDLVKRIRVTDTDADSVLVTVDLAYYISHQVVSNGAKQVAVDLINSPVYGKRIWIDAGHGKIPGGNDDPGTIGTTYGTLEKEVNLEVALALQRQLEEAGAVVYMTRTGDEGIDFRDRPAVVNAVNPPIDLFISIHHNANTSSAVRGTETYYWTEQSWALAQYVQKATASHLGFINRGVRRNDFYVVKATAAPSVLVELGYLSNPDEEYFIAEPGQTVRSYPEEAARGIFNGILDYSWQEFQ